MKKHSIKILVSGILFLFLGERCAAQTLAANAVNDSVAAANQVQAPIPVLAASSVNQGAPGANASAATPVLAPRGSDPSATGATNAPPAGTRPKED